METVESRATGSTVGRDEILERVLKVHHLLCEQYHCLIAYFHHLDPLSELISSLLSHRTTNHNSGRAFKALKARYKTWEELRDAPTGKLSLDFLSDLPEDDAQAWLESIPGIGPKTSAAVLLFSHLRKPALPVDSHHHRVALRLGWISAKTGPGPAHALLRKLLPKDWDAQQLYDHHEVMMFHGQRCCYYQNPACQRCVLLSDCPTGQVIMQKEKPLQ